MADLLAHPLAHSGDAATAPPRNTGRHPPTPPSAMQPTARPDLYAPIHKALRLFMTDTLLRLGRLDPQDAAERFQTLAQLRGLLQACARHLKRENDFVHAALEARRPGASAAIGAEHEAHLDASAGLELEAQALEARPDAAVALHLYRRLSRFVAENFEHMWVEETRLNAALWELYSDAELHALHRRVLASIPPDELLQMLRWIVPALNPPERIELLGGMPEPLRAVALAQVQAHLPAASWQALRRAVTGAPALA